VTVPVGGLAGAITIAESPTWRLTWVLALSGGIDESVAVTKMGYVPAFAGVPDNCPEALSVRPGGREPDSLQPNGGVPPEAVKV
jgi:hypothetical protein